MGYSINHKMLILQKVLPPNNRLVSTPVVTAR